MARSPGGNGLYRWRRARRSNSFNCRAGDFPFVPFLLPTVLLLITRLLAIKALFLGGVLFWGIAVRGSLLALYW